MDSMVEENGGNSSIDPLSVGGPTGNGTDNSSGVEGAAGDSRQQQQQHQQQSHQQQHQTNSSEFPANILTAHSPGLTVLKNPQNVVHLITHPAQSSVIQSSVIQSANHLQPMQTNKAGVGVVPVGGPPPSSHTVYVTSKASSVIQAPGIRAIKQEPYSSSSLQAMDSSDEDDSCSDEDAASRKRRDMLTRRPSYHKILKDISGPDMSVLSGPVVPEDQSRKREIRLQKNREAARECRRKKKEYIKCLENRVAVLENQNKALIEELKSLKELYCMTKTE